MTMSRLIKRQAGSAVEQLLLDNNFEQLDSGDYCCSFFEPVIVDVDVDGTTLSTGFAFEYITLTLDDDGADLELYIGLDNNEHRLRLSTSELTELLKHNTLPESVFDQLGQRFKMRLKESAIVQREQRDVDGV